MKMLATCGPGRYTSSSSAWNGAPASEAGE
jgi:hypothetical protein